MIYDTREWKIIERQEPLLKPELAKLRQAIQESAEIGLAIVMWGEALQDWSFTLIMDTIYGAVPGYPTAEEIELHQVQDFLSQEYEAHKAQDAQHNAITAPDTFFQALQEVRVERPPRENPFFALLRKVRELL